VLKSRGLKIGVIKHHPHGFEIDTPGKDSWRYAQAGSDMVVLSSPERLALISRQEQEMALDAVVGTYLQDMDLVITEGYKTGPKKKIEVSRRGRSQDLVSPAQDLIAIVTDQSFDLPVPHFGLDDAEAVADLLEEDILSRD
jgi:molybdopterin-guanine dinucleotide biosynthesis protein B